MTANTNTVKCSDCGRTFVDDEVFEEKGGQWCNLGDCQNAPICKSCERAHYDDH